MSDELQTYICPECERHRATLKPPVTYRDLRCYICNDAFVHEVQVVPTDDRCVCCGITVYEDEYCKRCKPDESGQVSLASI